MGPYAIPKYNADITPMRQWALNIPMSARALDSYFIYQGMYCIYYVWRPSASVPIGSSEPTGFAWLRRDGSRRRVLIERLEA